MSASGQPYSEDLQTLEELISQAGDYVVPSTDLQPELMQVAREHQRLRRFTRNAGLLSLGIVLFWGILLPAISSLRHLRPRVTAPMASEVEVMAQERYPYFQQAYDQTSWSLVDTFTEVRALDVPASQRGDRPQPKSPANAR